MNKRSTEKTITTILIRSLLAVAVSVIIALQLCGYKLLLIMSDSMEPALTTGQLVPARRVTEETELLRGDICTYKTDTGLVSVTHRIIAVAPEGFIFKGDHNRAEDLEPVKREQILYKLIIHEGGRYEEK